MSMLGNIFKFKKKSNKLSARDEIIEEAKSTAPSTAMIAEASNNPGGWVYVIRGYFGPHDAVPPQAIVGAWKVNSNGKLTDEFKENQNFQPQQ